MKFEICLYNEDDIKKISASFCLGWFEILSGETSISLFKSGLCMVFLNLTTLLEFLYKYHDNKTFRWIGDDNGYIYVMKRKNKYVEIQFDDGIFNLNFETFSKTVYEGSMAFVSKVNSINPAIVEESGYIDLQNVLNEINL